MEASTFRFAVSATFTGEPLEPVLAFWGRRLALPLEVTFAAYNQVSQTLLDVSSVFGSNRHGVNAVLVRVEDLAQFDSNDAATLPRIEENLRALLDLVRSAPAHTSVPLIFVLCPSSAEFVADCLDSRRRVEKRAEFHIDVAPFLHGRVAVDVRRLGSARGHTGRLHKPP